MGLLDALRDPQFRSDLGTNAKQLGQSASNTIAEGVTMPVDALAWLLRKGGANVPQNPLGGSDWAKQQGLMADVPAGAPKMAGEALGLLAPMAATKQGANALATALRQGGDNLSKARTMNPQTGAIVWHGSPHKFDKFDASKIGTGEGAQAYGHGLYLADNPSVAKEYQTKLSNTGSAKHLASQYGGIDDAFAEAQKRVEHYKKIIADGGGGSMRTANNMLNIAEKNVKDLADMRAGLPENTGSLYKVDLPDDQIARMLDWDKPLSQQPKGAQAALAKLDPDMYHPTGGDYDPTELGQMIYQRLAQKGQDAAATSMRGAGIPGIRYLDGGSRGAGQGSSNFVVFPGNENMLRILERNGQGLLK